MKKYKVTIRAEITKDIIVTAADEDEAVEAAHQQFSGAPDGTPERYNEETEAVEEIDS